jgi:hypothetical protein
VPVTYREYVYLVPPGTTEADAERLLRAQLDLVCTSLERFPPGKFVNLAVVDVSFQGKPPVPPLATMTWKDWRGPGAIAFPRHPAPLRAPNASPASAASEVARPQPAAVVEPAPPAASFTLVEAPATVSASAVVHAPTPTTVEPPPAEEAQTAPPVSQRAPAPDGADRAPTARVSGEELVADLFEVMHELHFLRDAVEGGHFCLALATEKLHCEVGIVHLYDIDRREFVITGTRGGESSALLLRRHSESDAILATAMRRRRTVVIADAGQSEGVDLGEVERYREVGGARSVIIAPVMQAGRFLGAIELLNPLDREPFTDLDGNAVMYIAEQFAEFVAARGVVTDPDRVTAKR